MDASKKNATLCEICAPLIRTALSWFVREAPGYGTAALFAKCAAIRRACHIFTAKGAPAILELQHFTRRCSAARPSKCGVLGGRKRRDLRHFFKCRRVPRLLHSF